MGKAHHGFSGQKPVPEQAPAPGILMRRSEGWRGPASGPELTVRYCPYPSEVPGGGGRRGWRGSQTV
jgi:hypothetical protein